MNLNYWRIEGIRRIYDVFDNDIKEIYSRDLSEYQPLLENSNNEENSEIINEDFKEFFEKSNIVEEKNVQKSIEETPETNSFEEISEEKNTDIVKNEKKKSKYGVLKSSKQALANAIYISLQTHEFSPKLKKSVEEVQEIEEQEDFGEGEYFDLDEKMASLDLLDAENEEEYDYEVNDDIELDTEDEMLGDEEESILDLYFQEQDKNTQKRKVKDNKKIEKDINKSGNIFKKIIGLNSKKKREA
jgi:hypothetical protein